MSYRVLVDDNFHYMDEEERYEAGVFDTCKDAVAACQRMVDDFLSSNYKPGMSSDELIELYNSFGEDPFIRSQDQDEACSFSAWTYAVERCSQMVTTSGD